MNIKYHEYGREDDIIIRRQRFKRSKNKHSHLRDKKQAAKVTYFDLHLCASHSQMPRCRHRLMHM